MIRKHIKTLRNTYQGVNESRSADSETFKSVSCRGKSLVLLNTGSTGFMRNQAETMSEH